MKPKAKIVIIDGIIGAGKTTIINRITQKYKRNGRNVCIIREPVHLWREVEILQKFYEDIPRWTYSLQTFIQITMDHEIKTQIKNNPNADLFIMERSMFSGLIFMSLTENLLTQCERDMFKQWNMHFIENSIIDIRTVETIILDTDLEICMNRIKLRGRPEELGISEDYQHRLQNAYKNFYLSDNCPVNRKNIKFLKEHKTLDETTQHFMEIIENL